MQSRIRIALFIACAALTVPVPAFAWDYPGHRIVGAIADAVLQQHYPKTYERVSELLEIKRPGELWQKLSVGGLAGRRRPATLWRHDRRAIQDARARAAHHPDVLPRRSEPTLGAMCRHLACDWTT